MNYKKYQLFTLLWLVLSIGWNSTLAQSTLDNSSSQDKIKVEGTVLDETGTPLPGVNVKIEGTSVGTITGFNGGFELLIEEGENIIVSFIGYKAQVIQIVGNKPLTIQMQQSLEQLSEVVVVGYGTMRKEDITSSVASVKQEDFQQGVVTSAAQLIQGKVPGLSISRGNGNDPNSSASIQLRGVSSVSAGTAPLVIIDGVPGADMKLLSQDEIESIEVLKDGSAAAIYGTRGTNGVILITTKRAQNKEGYSELSYTGSVQSEYITNRPEAISASQFRALIEDGTITSSPDLGYDTKWFDELIQTPVTQYHNLSLSGGNNQFSYRASGFLRDATPIVENTGRQEYGGKVSINHKALNNRLKIQADLQNTVVDARFMDNDIFEQSIVRNPTFPVMDPDDPTKYYDPIGAYGHFNPVAKQNQLEKTEQQSYLLASGRVSYEFFEGLEASVFGAVTRDIKKYNEYLDSDARQSISDQVAGRASRTDHFSQNRTLDLTLKYKLLTNNKHNFDVLGGYSYQDFSYENISVSNGDFVFDHTKWWDIGSGNLLKEGRAGMGSFRESSRLIGFFGRANYAFDNKYLLSVSARYEGSTRFGDDNKWGLFPAVSAGWRISQENFLKDIDMIDELKIRAGYGVTGNQDFGNYRSITTMSSFGRYYDVETGKWITGYGPGQNTNPNLGWERKSEWNVGLDFTLFDERLSGTLDVYKRITDDLLFTYDAPTPPNIHPTIFTNVGSMSNSGIELGLNAEVVRKKNFKWNAYFNISFLDNELTKLSNEYYQAGYIDLYGLSGSTAFLNDAMRLEEGRRVGSFYGYRNAGFTPEGEWLFFTQDGELTTDPTTEDRQYIGNGLPTTNLGFGSNFSYKQWDFSFFFRGELGFDILNQKEMFYANKANLNGFNQLETALTTHEHINDVVFYSDYYLEKGDYLKLDNISLGYNFPLQESSPIKRLRISASAQNILTITNYTGLDPEVWNSGLTPGIDGNSFYPRTATYSLMLNMTL
ncbi:TonB-dependent receptor [Flammeovirga sp. SJP92]|uniref:SusC/RagA family TonB-linked outer membrane protein n=1 Tax=Flammeovirga sp. SJP92 TaxID=1775430 RepID=UPI00078950A6|nr:TonB-dependent receptor [Flammeovirga sp. SJP92]KXX71869.1 hypothetical protein AVL50_03535 [Flammeovirga sp. SJP92]